MIAKLLIYKALATFLKTVEVRASGGSNPSPTASHSLSVRSQKNTFSPSFPQLGENKTFHVPKRGAHFLIFALFWIAAAGATAQDRLAEGAWFLQIGGDFQTRTNQEWNEPGCNRFTCTGGQWRAELKFGVELAPGDWRNNPWIPIFQVYFKHRSDFRTGWPFDNNEQLETDYMGISFEIGGLRG